MLYSNGSECWCHFSWETAYYDYYYYHYYNCNCRTRRRWLADVRTKARTWLGTSQMRLLLYSEAVHLIMRTTAMSPGSSIHSSWTHGWCTWQTAARLMRLSVLVLLWSGVCWSMCWRQWQIERNILITRRPPQQLRRVFVSLWVSSRLIMLAVMVMLMMWNRTVFNWRTHKTRQEPAVPPRSFATFHYSCYYTTSALTLTARCTQLSTSGD